MNKINIFGYLKAISDKSRLRILKFLKEGELCVCEIYPKLKLSQNLTSHHLKVLRQAGLVTSRREGLKIIYSRNDELIKRYQQLLTTSI